MEARLFPEGTIPEWTTSEWYAGRESAPHLEQEGHRERLLAVADLIEFFSTSLRLWTDSSGNTVNDRLVKGPVTVVDLGAGDGGLLSVIQNMDINCWGYDLQQTNVTVANEQRNSDVSYLDVVKDISKIQWGDIAVATEMLEHLLDPHSFVQEISKNSNILIASSPWHETAESHYEYHTFCWDEVGYANLLQTNGFPIIKNHFRVSGAQIIVGSK